MAKPNNSIGTIKLPGDTTQRPIIPSSLTDGTYLATLPTLTADSVIALRSDVPDLELQVDIDLGSEPSTATGTFTAAEMAILAKDGSYICGTDSSNQKYYFYAYNTQANIKNYKLGTTTATVSNYLMSIDMNIGVNTLTGGWSAQPISFQFYNTTQTDDKFQDKLPTVVKDRYLHTNASTGAFEWTTVTSGPTTYLKSASSSGNTLTLTKQDNTTVTYTPTFTEQHVGDVVSVGATSGSNISIGGTAANPTVGVASGYSIPSTTDQTSWTNKYSKPSGGIPDSDLANAFIRRFSVDAQDQDYTEPIGTLFNIGVDPVIYGIEIQGSESTRYNYLLSIRPYQSQDIMLAEVSFYSLDDQAFINYEDVDLEGYSLSDLVDEIQAYGATIATTQYVAANPSTTTATLTGIRIGGVSYAISAGTDNDHYPTTFAWTNGTTAGPTGSLTGNSGFSAVSFGAIPAASGSQSGIVTTGAQTFAGNKTFNGYTNLNGGTSFTNGTNYFSSNNPQYIPISIIYASDLVDACLHIFDDNCYADWNITTDQDAEEEAEYTITLPARSGMLGLRIDIVDLTNL